MVAGREPLPDLTNVAAGGTDRPDIELGAIVAVLAQRVEPVTAG